MSEFKSKSSPTNLFSPNAIANDDYATSQDSPSSRDNSSTSTPAEKLSQNNLLYQGSSLNSSPSSISFFTHSEGEEFINPSFSGPFGSPDFWTPETETEIKGPTSWFSKYGGIFLTLFAGLNFTFASVFAKLLWEEYGFNAYSTTFWRYFGVLLVGLPLFCYFEFFYKKLPERPSSAVWPPNNKQKILNCFGLLVRGILGTSAVVFRYYAIEYIPLGDMNVISFSTPLLVTFLAHFFLGEKCGIVPIIATLVALVGVFVIIRPPLLTGESDFDHNSLIGAGLAGGSLICGAIIIILTRKMRTIHFSLMTFVFGVIGVLGSYLLTLTEPSKHPFMYPNGGDREIFLVVGLGIVSFIGQIAIIIATQMEQAGLVSLMRTNDVILGFIFEYLIFSIIPTIYSAIGGLIVFSSICVIGFRKWLSTLPEENRKRKMCSFFLK